MAYDAIIIGGGPAGSSAAICLSQLGARVLVLEEKHMPRGKLCGEFITPECFPTLERLGVMERMLASGARKISRVSLVVSSGKSVHTQIAKVPGGSSCALSLSRARFDQILFDRAREAGAECREGVAVRGCSLANTVHRVEALSLSEGSGISFDAPLIIDASGRNSRLMVGKKERIAGRRGARLYALKAHFEGAQDIDDQVELYFFSQGYGGLSQVENGLVNLCFIVDERTLKDAGGEPLKVVDQTLMRNSLACQRLQRAEVVGKWHSAGPLTFGRRRLARDGVIAIGDASGMIDPFTGTGIQIALRTGELAAAAIIEAMGAPRETPASGIPNTAAESAAGEAGSSTILDSVLSSYARRYQLEFSNRMKFAGLLRLAAFSPVAASAFAGVLARFPRLTDLVFRGTRSGDVSQNLSQRSA